MSTQPTSGKWERVETDAGLVWKRWADRSRTFDTKDAADIFASERTIAAKRGERFVEARTIATPTLGAMCDAYVEAAKNGPPSTQANRKWHMNSFLAFAGRDTPVTALSAQLLEAYAETLPTTGRKAATRHRKVFEAQHAWKWGRKRPDRWPGVPDVVEVVGTDEGSVVAPPPVVRMAVPTFDDVDAMISKLRMGYRHGDTARRVAILLRYTGMRKSQALGLRWSDVVFATEPDGVGYVVLRAGVVGAKKGRTRVIPMHAGLAAEMAGWGMREGMIFQETNVSRTSHAGKGGHLIDAFKTAWEAAGVDPAKWGIADDADTESAGQRAYGSPVHSLRAALKVGLLRAGVAEFVADYFIGHATTATAAAYVPEANPETSPYWPHLVAALAHIPDHREWKAPSKMQAKG